MVAECTRRTFDFQPVGRRQVSARFDGGNISSEVLPRYPCSATSVDDSVPCSTSVGSRRSISEFLEKVTRSEAATLAPTTVVRSNAISAREFEAWSKLRCWTSDTCTSGPTGFK